MITRNRENKGKMPRVTLGIMLNPTKIDEFGSWSWGSWKATRHGQEVSLATNSRQPPPKALNIYNEQPGRLNTFHTQYLQKGRLGKMLGIFAGKIHDPLYTSQPLAYIERQCETGIVMILFDINPWYIRSIYCYLPTEETYLILHW